jgi:hypothetical protein
MSSTPQRVQCRERREVAVVRHLMACRNAIGSAMTAATVSGPRAGSPADVAGAPSEQPPSRVQRPQRPGDGWVTGRTPARAARRARATGMPVADIAVRRAVGASRPMILTLPCRPGGDGSPHDLERRLVGLTPVEPNRNSGSATGRAASTARRAPRPPGATGPGRATPTERAGLLGHRGPDLLASVSDRAGAEVFAGVEEPASWSSTTWRLAAHQDARVAPGKRRSSSESSRSSGELVP